MFERRSLTGPITLGVLMIVSVIALTAGWISLNIIGASENGAPAAFYWSLLAVGCVLFVCILLGVIAYLTLSVKAINLNRRQSNFIDSVTHELKSPIASLKLYLQTLALRPVDDRERADFHRFMLEDVERLDQLINHLLDVGRVERLSEKAVEEECRLDIVLRQCIEAVCLRYHLPQSTVQCDVPPIVIRTRPVELDILFRNLIDNAVKYGGRPPEVSVVAQRLGADRVIVSVIDNGAGIPPNLRSKVFGRFVRLGNELERSKPGTGLGLYLVRNIVRSLRGIVRVQDRRDGSGTEFEVTLSGVVPHDGQPDAHPAASLSNTHS